MCVYIYIYLYTKKSLLRSRARLEIILELRESRLSRERHKKRANNAKSTDIITTPALIRLSMGGTVEPRPCPGSSFPPFCPSASFPTSTPRARLPPARVPDDDVSPARDVDTTVAGDRHRATPPRFPAFLRASRRSYGVLKRERETDGRTERERSENPKRHIFGSSREEGNPPSLPTTRDPRICVEVRTYVRVRTA